MLRIKMGPPQQRNSNFNNPHSGKEWTCCFGLHVHTATIMIGIWHLFLNILALSLLALIWRNPHMMEELENSYDYNVDLNAPPLPTPLSKTEYTPSAYREHALNYRKHYQNFDMGGLVCTCMIAITMMMIYGTIKGKPSHLLPFFCLQLFDFAITTLTAAGYLCYLQAIHRLIAESHRLPWREKLLELSPEQLVVVVLVVFVCIVFLKAYAIGIVWRCYKYLTLRQQQLRSMLPCILSELGGGTGGLSAAEQHRPYSALLPNYDEAIAQYMKQMPPPSYQVAMSNYQTDPSAVVVGAGGGGVVAAAGVAVHGQVVAGAGAGHDNTIGGGNNNPASLLTGEAAEVDEDNNNDSSNNNNTVHVNANSPPVRRSVSEGSPSSTTPLAPGAGNARDDDEDDDADDDDVADVEVVDLATPPPSYHVAITGMPARSPMRSAAFVNGGGGNESHA